jgi:predicted dehydrogenase
LVNQVYAVRDGTDPFAPVDELAVGGVDAYRRHAVDQPAWSAGIGKLDPEVSALFDPDTDAMRHLEGVCRENGDDPTLYDSFDALVDAARFDAAVVASPNFAHCEHAGTLLERGVDTFCEKPIGLTLAEHDLLIEADDCSDALFYIGFNLRTHPVYAKIADLVAKGSIGNLGMVTSHNVRRPFPPGFRYDAKQSGGTLLEKNCHDFDLYNWYIEADPVRTAAFGGQRVLSEGTDTLDHATVIAEYENGAKATLELSMFSPFTQERHRRYFLRGEDGVLRTPDEADAIDVYDRTTASRIRTRAHVDSDDAVHGGADYRQTVRFLQCLEGESTRPASPVDAKKAAAIAIGAQQSIDENCVYRIGDDYDVEPV